MGRRVTLNLVVLNHICSTGFTGSQCEHCTDLFCKNGGICRRNEPEKNRCECPDGFFGRQREIDACTDYCLNGGECTFNITGLECKCMSGFQGSQSDELDEYDGYCYNGGTCLWIDDRKVCKCLEQYTGRQCNVDDLCQIAMKTPGNLSN